MNKILIITLLTVIFGSLAYFVLIRDISERDSILIGYSGHSLNYGSAILTSEAKFFEKNGSAASLVPFKSGKEVSLALATGKTDLALMSIANILVAIDAGIPIKVICPTTKSSTVVYVRPDGEIKTLRDLVGKNINGDRGTSRMEFLRGAATKNLNSSDFKFIEIEKDYREIALLEQKVLDAIPTSRYNEDSLIKAGAMPLEEWNNDGLSDIFNPHTFLVVSSKFAENGENEIEKIINAFGDAQKFALASPVEAATLISENIKKSTDGIVNFTVSQILESWNKSIKYVIWSDPKEVEEIVEYMVESKELKNKLLLEEIFDFRFLGLLENRQEEIYGAKN